MKLTRDQQNPTACVHISERVKAISFALGKEGMSRDQASLANDHSAPALSWPVINASARVFSN
jgi:hypothetical protein